MTLAVAEALNPNKPKPRISLATRHFDIGEYNCNVANKFDLSIATVATASRPTHPINNALHRLGDRQRQKVVQSKGRVTLARL